MATALVQTVPPDLSSFESRMQLLIDLQRLKEVADASFASLRQNVQDEHVLEKKLSARIQSLLSEAEMGNSFKGSPTKSSRVHRASMRLGQPQGGLHTYRTLNSLRPFSQGPLEILPAYTCGDSIKKQSTRDIYTFFRRAASSAKFALQNA